MLTIEKVRQKFLDFYGERGFAKLERYPLIHPLFPYSFIPSAVFKLWVPEIEEKNIIQSMRIQPCIRSTDMNFIQTGNHLTFFEMMAVIVTNRETEEGHRWITDLCHSFLTKVLNVPANNLWATVFEGGQIFNIYCGPDEMTRDIWIQKGIPETHIISYGYQKNFTGKLDSEIVAGPTTELFYDKGKSLMCPPPQVCIPGHSDSCHRFVELVNIGLITYDKIKQGDSFVLVPRREKLFGSAIGLERVSYVLQGKKRITQIPEIDYLIRKIDRGEKNRLLLEEIVDLVRTLVFMLGAGARPGHGGRAYVVKKFIRRCFNNITILNLSFSVIEDLVFEILHQYESIYNFLNNSYGEIIEVLHKEYELFTNKPKKYRVI